MIGEATAGLGAVVDSKEFTRIVRTSSQQHAELEAALLAVRKAPIEQPLKLHVDCLNALQPLTQPNLLISAFQVMVRHIITVAHQRQIALTLQHIRGDDNPAHPVARRARLMPPNQPVSDERLYLRVRQHGPQVTVLGLGDPLVFPDHPAGFQLAPAPGCAGSRRREANPSDPEIIFSGMLGPGQFSLSLEISYVDTLKPYFHKYFCFLVFLFSWI
ncbi:ribonuclease H family protein [Deinococcus sp. Leaf326]|uniref:ribonuclease H family protein n=1 Tax=Deinococcus sp. Leaf326 TaxID=1736338 RepID=UPI0012E2D1CC|nr:ribonuclease H family protein [Deinococcus sp. Leaf326]